MAGSSPRMTREQQFLSLLPEIERAIGWVCRRRGLRGADAEDFASTVKLRLIENDYEVLAKFEGRCSLATFLTVVVTRLFFDFQARRYGKWRNSAEARRLGPVAIRLECLMQRDKLTFDEACGVLGSDPGVEESREALYEMSLRLPRRSPLPKNAGPLEAGATLPAPSDVDRAERQELANRTFALIRSALGRLPVIDRLFLRLHLVEGMTVAEVSRSLGLDQKPLYRRKGQLFMQLRVELEQAGIGPTTASELLSAVDWEAEFVDGTASADTGPEPAARGPSSQWRGAAERESES